MEDKVTPDKATQPSPGDDQRTANNLSLGQNVNPKKLIAFLKDEFGVGSYEVHVLRYPSTSIQPKHR